MSYSSTICLTFVPFTKVSCPYMHGSISEFYSAPSDQWFCAASRRGSLILAKNKEVNELASWHEAFCPTEVTEQTSSRKAQHCYLCKIKFQIVKQCKVQNGTFNPGSWLLTCGQSEWSVGLRGSRLQRLKEALWGYGGRMSIYIK